MLGCFGVASVFCFIVIDLGFCCLRDLCLRWLVLWCYIALNGFGLCLMLSCVLV